MRLTSSTATNGFKLFSCSSNSRSPNTGGSSFAQTLAACSAFFAAFSPQRDAGTRICVMPAKTTTVSSILSPSSVNALFSIVCGKGIATLPRKRCSASRFISQRTSSSAPETSSVISVFSPICRFFFCASHAARERLALPQNSPAIICRRFSAAGFSASSI